MLPELYKKIKKNPVSRQKREKDSEDQGEIRNKSENTCVYEYTHRWENYRTSEAINKKTADSNSEKTKSRRQGSNLRSAYFRIRVKNLRGDNTNWKTRENNFRKEKKAKPKPIVGQH